MARNADSVLLGTATAIQLDAVEPWDSRAALGQGAPQVLGVAGEGSESMYELGITAEFMPEQKAA